MATKQALQQSLDGEVIEPPVKEKAEKKESISPFDFVKAITFTKDSLIVDAESEKQYVPFVVNRALSYSVDCAIAANAMNQYPNADHRMQFEFLRAFIPKKKRFDPWQKSAGTEKIRLIKQFYKYSTLKALQVADLFDEEAMVRLKQKMFTGGTDVPPT